MYKRCLVVQVTLVLSEEFSVDQKPVKRKISRSNRRKKIVYKIIKCLYFDYLKRTKRLHGTTATQF